MILLCYLPRTSPACSMDLCGVIRKQNGLPCGRRTADVRLSAPIAIGESWGKALLIFRLTAYAQSLSGLDEIKSDTYFAVTRILESKSAMLTLRVMRLK